MLTDVQPLSVKAKLKALRTVYPVPFGGETFHVRALTINELNALPETSGAGEDDEKKVSFGKALLAASLCDEFGAPVFEGVEDPDIDSVPTDALKVLIEGAGERNGLKEPGNA